MSAIDTSVVLISWSPNDYRMKILRQSFESLKKHTIRSYTLVVVDNGPEAQSKYFDGQEIDVLIRPEVNLGVGVSRNEGAKATDSEFIAFVDNDIGYFPGWLNECVECLKYYDRKLIATAVKNHPMKQRKYQAGKLDGHNLYSRCAGMCMVMKRRTYNDLGGFSEASNVGHRFSEAARRNGYRFIHHPDWNGRHIGRVASYHYKKQIFDKATGLWVPKESNA